MNSFATNVTVTVDINSIIELAVAGIVVILLYFLIRYLFIK